MIAAALMVLLLLCPAVRAAQAPASFAYDQRPGSQLPLSAPFRDQDGHSVTLGQALEGRPSVLVLGYFHCPNLCGLVRDDLMNALSRLEGDQDYSLVVISIDPAETAGDARAALIADEARFDGDHRRMHYLTGPQASISAVANSIGFRSKFDAEAKQFLHPSGIVFLTRQGTVSSYLLGLGYQPGDVSLGITRAANGVTARTLPILLLCFHYDKATGRYTLATMRLVQIGGAITVLALGGTIALALRRERR